MFRSAAAVGASTEQSTNRVLVFANGDNNWTDGAIGWSWSAPRADQGPRHDRGRVLPGAEVRQRLRRRGGLSLFVPSSHGGKPSTDYDDAIKVGFEGAHGVVWDTTPDLLIAIGKNAPRAYTLKTNSNDIIIGLNLVTHHAVQRHRARPSAGLQLGRAAPYGGRHRRRPRRLGDQAHLRQRGQHLDVRLDPDPYLDLHQVLQPTARRDGLWDGRPEPGRVVERHRRASSRG